MTWQFKAFNLLVFILTAAALIGGALRGDLVGATIVMVAVVAGMLHLIMVRYSGAI